LVTGEVEMVDGVTRRVVVGGMLAMLAGAPLVAASAAVAAGPTEVTITGQGLAAPLTIRAESDPELFSAVLAQVSWLAVGKGNATAIPADKLGPKYTVVVQVQEKATRTYDLYPLAVGGPRAFRPAKQPDKRATTAGWFYARLTMPQTLVAAGVPLPDQPGVITGGLGGGAAADMPPLFEEDSDLDWVLGKWRLVTLLNGGVVLVIAMGLAGMAYLIRRKV
jgi:hypothetical protein